MCKAAFELVRTGEVPVANDWLGRRERRAAERFTVTRRRAEWRAGRWAAKRAVAKFGAAAPVEILTAPDGAPEAWDGDRRAPVNVSISHRGGFAAALATPADVAAGCDLELVEPRQPGFASDWFTPAELAGVESASREERNAAIALTWSAKESVLKLLHCGLGIDTRRVEISLGDGAFAAAIDGRRINGWWIRDGDLVVTAALERKR